MGMDNDTSDVLKQREMVAFEEVLDTIFLNNLHFTQVFSEKIYNVKFLQQICLFQRDKWIVAL